MKKIILSLFLIFSFTLNVNADSIKNINMDIYIDSNGNANITEIWKVNINNGTEGYKPYYNLGNSEIKNFTVTDDKNNLYKFKDNWDPYDSFTEKTYKNGINELYNGVELCWGISKYGNRTYTLKYEITNFVADLTDSQMIYWTLIPYELSLEPKEVNIVIRSDIKFSDNIEVWGYGNYGGTAYVYNGNIEMNSDGKLASDEYMTILIKLPEDMFNTTNKLNYDFDFYYRKAERGAVKYELTTNFHFNTTSILGFILPVIIWFFIALGILKATKGAFQRKTFQKVISKGKFSNNLNYYRDIPCNKDIFYAYFLASDYKLNKKNTDFLGAIILSWIKKGYVNIEKQEKKKMLKTTEESYLIFQKDALTEDNLESKMYKYMYSASEDGILESKDFEKYCEKNYSTIIKWFDKVLDDQRDSCVEQNLIINEKKMFNKYYETKEVYEEAKNLAGLKKFFEDFSSMENKSAIEVHLWDYYLQYAQIFGIADKVASEFKKLYPDVITDIVYNDFVFINSFSSSAIKSATTAQSRAQSYSSGGGGFSSGGGGGGSFGGGGGGGGFR